jgi:glycosyltransferase involved in cell wall biosynthesis
MARSVCVDGLPLGRSYFGCGINRYCVNLLSQLERITARTAFRTQIVLESVADLEHNGLSPRSGFELVPCAAVRSTRLWRRVMLMETARRLKADSVLMPSPGPVYFKRLKLAVTVHDLIPLLFPGAFRSWSGRQMQRHYLSSLRKADLILTDSECSKVDMVGTFKVPPERIVVAYLGCDSPQLKSGSTGLPEKQQMCMRYGINRPYVLHVGRLEPRKNLDRLIQAYQLLRGRRKDLDFLLVLCGTKGPGAEDLLKLLGDPELQTQVVWTGAVSDRDLALLYEGAVCCAMPSLYEGFGLPVLEAMASGVPVMSSDRSSLPEIGGDAALYFNPESVEEMSAALERLLTDSALRQQLRGRGLERAQRFSWKECAQTTLAALEEL